MEPTLVKVAVVGYGYWGAHHVRVLSSLKRVQVTIVDIDGDRLGEATSQYPRIRCAARIEDVLDEIDCVVVATSPREHAEVALRSLHAQKHVLVEKPFTTSVHAAEELVTTAASRGVSLMVGHTFEYHGAAQELRAMIAADELGRILYIDSARLGLGRYQQDVSVVWDLAPHDISIASFLLGESPYAVSAWEHHSVNHHQSDLAYLRLDFEETAATAFINVSWLAPNKVRRVTVVGDRRMAVYDYLSTVEPLRIFDIGVDPVLDDVANPDAIVGVSYRTGDILSPYVSFNEPLVAQDAHFIDCVRTGRRPNTPGEHGVDNVRVLAGLEAAHRSGQRVILDGRRC